MSFKKTAISLIAVALITAAIVGVYLWFNFNARSNLVMVVPKNVSWFYHFQTSQIRKNTTGDKPPYLDSFMIQVKALPVFAHVKDPAETGIKLHSDVVMFGNKYGVYLVLSLNSESSWNHFVESIPKNVYTGSVSTARDCKFLKVSNRNLYIGFRHKALAIFSPYDTTDKLNNIESGFSEVFGSESDKKITSTRAVQKLYDAECDVICYQRLKSPIPSHGVILKNQQAKFISATSGREIQARNALKMFEVAGLIDVKKNKTIKTNQYLNLTFKAAFNNLKNQSK